MDKEPVTIVGAGIVGICCALSLANRGVPVCLIDRAEPGQETSYGNAGVISPWSIIPIAMPSTWKKVPAMLFGSDRPLAVKTNFWPRMIPWGLNFLFTANEKNVRHRADAMRLLCEPCVDLFRQHLQGTGFEDLIADSYYVHAFRNENNVSLSSLDYQIRQEKGCELELLDQNELQKLEPSLSSDFKAAVLIKGQARALTPGKIAEVLTEKAKSLGVKVLNLDIKEIKKNEQDWDVIGQDKTIKSKKIIVAAGIWSKELLKPLDVELPLVAERGYHMQFADAEIQINNSVMDVDAKIVASSMQDGVRLAGAAEFANPEHSPDISREALLTQQAKRMFPNLQTNKSSFWMGRRPSFHDSLPVLGEVEEHKGLFTAFGHSHFGLMMAPKTGEVLAEHITNDLEKTDLSAFSYKRFN